MFTVEKPSPNRIDIVINGQLDADTMRQALDALVTKSDDIVEGRMLYTINDFAFPTLAAIGVDFARIPALFGVIGKFDKCAVLADASWIRAIAAIEGALIPGLAIKAFDEDETAQAEAWLAT